MHEGWQAGMKTHRETFSSRSCYTRCQTTHAEIKETKSHKCFTDDMEQQKFISIHHWKKVLSYTVSGYNLKKKMLLTLRNTHSSVGTAPDYFTGLGLTFLTHRYVRFFRLAFFSLSVIDRYNPNTELLKNHPSIHLCHLNKISHFFLCKWFRMYKTQW